MARLVGLVAPAIMFVSVCFRGAHGFLFGAPVMAPQAHSVSLASSRSCSSSLMMSTLDASEAYTRQQLAAKQAEYDAKRKAAAAAAARQSGSNEAAAVLAELPSIPYLTAEGKISDVQAGPNVKASVYAIYGEGGDLQYIGVSRNVQQSLRLHLARCPEFCYSVKVQHITRPSRTILEITKDAWQAENGGPPPGNDKGAMQAKWENPLDVKPLMTEQDKADISDAKARGKEESAIKKVARRFEDEKVAVLEARGVTENLRFDPKLKGTGLLDLWTERPKNEIPSDKPKKAAGKPEAKRPAA